MRLAKSDTMDESINANQDSENNGLSLNINDGFPLLAASIKKCATGMTGWSIGDLTLGLYNLYQRHLQEGAIDTVSGSQVQDINEFEEMCHWLKWAIAAYKTDRSSVAECLQISEMQIKKHVRTAAVLRPSYYIAVDNVKQCLVMAIRGTVSTTDIVTDLNPHSEKFEKGHAHSGMLAAAKWLMEEEHENIQILMATYPGYKIVLTGHSLGAGTASLFCILLQEKFLKLNIPNSLLFCWGFGCPPCMDEKLSEEAASIKNLILQDDIVARLSPAALEDLRCEISKTEWAQNLVANGKLKKVVELAQTASEFVDGIEARLGYERGHFRKQIKSLVMTESAETQQNASSSNDKTFTKWTLFGASTLFRCAEMFSTLSTDQPQTGTGLATPAVANVAARNDTSKSSTCDVRLYVPGILYHVICKENLRNVQHVLANNLEANKELEMATVSTKQYTVTRGDPTFRFKRIVLSNSMISDHSAESYKSALDGALEYARKSVSVKCGRNDCT